MAIKEADTKSGPLVLVTRESGVTIIPQPTPLTRLNYFDGKFLRASDLKTEQLYLRRLVQISNQAGGSGVVHGYDLTLGSGGESLSLGPGLAIDPEGRVLLLPEPTSIGVQQLIERSRARTASTVGAAKAADAFGDCMLVAEAPPDSVVRVGDLYLIVIGAVEALCGQEDVFGKLCEEACATSTDRPYLLEGLVVRAVPLQLRTPLPTSGSVALSRLHLRSRVASSYFQDERASVASFISGDGLRANVWCLGADAAGGRDVPLGVLARSGSTTVFLDAWIARRERMDGPPRRYWQCRMAMRPWDVFLAQILQFQCQLRDLFQGKPPAGGGDDPCADTHTLVREASETVARVTTFYRDVTARFTRLPLPEPGEARLPMLEGGLARLHDFDKRLRVAVDALAVSSTQVLIDAGMVEMSCVGYLPVDPTALASVNQQVRRLLGDGVDLRFCIVRPDFVAHALEEAQHMERISLLQGLDDRQQKPQVDILVPDGESLQPKPASGVVFEAEVTFGPDDTLTKNLAVIRRMRGAAHIAVPEAGKVEIYTAVNLEAVDAPVDPAFPNRVVEVDRTLLTRRRIKAARPVDADDVSLRAAVRRPPVNSLWAAATCSTNPFAATAAGSVLLDARLVATSAVGAALGSDDVRIVGTFTFNRPQPSGAQVTVTGRLDGMLSVVTARGNVAPDQSHSRLVVDVSAVLSNSDPTSPHVTVAFFNREAKVAVTLEAGWSGSPRTIVARLSSTTLGNETGRSTTLFSSRFKQNDEVLLPQNALHLQALRALDALGTALADRQFAAVSAALLFPPPPAAAEDLQIRATRDWVLFHRRRTKQCEPERPVVVVPSRRYQWWHGQVANLDFLKLTVAALRSGDRFDPQGVFFERVNIVEFAPGVPTLASSPQAVLEDWKRVDPGQQLLYDAVANGEEAKKDGVDLAKARLTQLEDVVSSVSRPPAGGVITEVLDRIHPDLVVPAVDGIMVALTVLEATCAAAFAAESLDRVQALLANNNLVAAVNASTPLGEARFRAGSTDVVGDSLSPIVAEWNKLGLAGRPPQAIAVLRQGNDTLKPELAAKQAVIIEAALGEGGAAKVVRVAADFPVSCPMIVFIQPGAVAVRNALLVYGNFDIENGSLLADQPANAPTAVQFSADVPQAGVLPKFIAALGPSRPVSVVMLTTAAAVDPGAQTRLAAVVAEVVKPPNFRQFVKALSPWLRDELKRNGLTPDNFDDVIFFSGMNLNGPD